MELRMKTDKDRLDWLQKNLGDYTGKVICRASTTGRGWRLHETCHETAFNDVREAIDDAMDNGL